MEKRINIFLKDILVTYVTYFGGVLNDYYLICYLIVLSALMFTFLALFEYFFFPDTITRGVNI